MIWFFAALLGVSCRALAGFGDERATLAALAEFEEARARLAEARKDEQRLLLIDRAMAFSQLEKQRASSEREKRERDIDRLKYLNRLRNWALDTFQAESRQQLPKTEGLSKRVERLQRVDAQFKHIYLSLPEQSRGAVRSGRALNFFLNVCGNVAESQEIYREQVHDEIARLKLEVTKAESEPDKHRKEVELERIQPLLEEALLKQKLLDQLSAKGVLTPEHLRKITYERGTIGGQIVISPRDGALPLNWPTYFVRNDSEYGVYRSLIEAAKATALEELKAGTGITAKTQIALMTATDNLTNRFNRDQDRLFRTGQVGSWERIESRNFITTLRTGVLRFVKARELSDVQPTAPFEGRRIDELLA
jgi:hypothetical protein